MIVTAFYSVCLSFLVLNLKCILSEINTGSSGISFENYSNYSNFTKILV